MSVRCVDFKPGSWEIIDDGKNVVDRTTGKTFDNETREHIRDDACLFSTLGIPLNAIYSSCYVGIRTLRLVFCYHCWKGPDKDVTLRCVDRVKDTGIDFVKCLGAPFICAAMQVMFCKTCICPTRDNRKYVYGLDKIQFDGEGAVASQFWPKEDRPATQTMSDDEEF